MKETSVRVVRPRITSRVVRMETAATASGTSARKEAKTRASTTSAPTAATRVSRRTPGPLLSPPDSSACRPVVATVSPGSEVRSEASMAEAAVSPPKEVAVGSKRRAKVERPSELTKPWSPVEA